MTAVSITEKPKWIIWLIWAIVGQYTDKMTQKCVKNESFCPCSDTHYGSNESNDSLGVFSDWWYWSIRGEIIDIHWSIDYQQDVRGKVVGWLGWGDQKDVIIITVDIPLTLNVLYLRWFLVSVFGHFCSRSTGWRSTIELFSIWNIQGWMGLNAVQASFTGSMAK